jgi:nicotinamidase-related amidase/3-polyprenyl-4-hydroxybenzoate decarboxylase
VDAQRSGQLNGSGGGIRSVVVAPSTTSNGAAAPNRVPAASMLSSHSDGAAPTPSDATVDSVPIRRSCLLVIDVQNDFCTGSLAAPDAESIIPRINALRTSRQWPLVVFTGDAHPAGHVSFHATHAHNPQARLFEPLTLPDGMEQVMWPVHCVSGTWGAQLHPELVREPSSDVILEKGVFKDREYYSAFKSTCGRHHTHLTSLLRAHGITDVITCGLVFEYCVGNSAIDAANAGFRTTLLTDATRGLTEEGMDAMKAKLKAAGVQLMESHELPPDTPLPPGWKPPQVEQNVQNRPADWPTTRSSSIASAPPSRVPSTYVATAAPTTAASSRAASNASCSSAAVTPVQSPAPSRANSTVSRQESLCNGNNNCGPNGASANANASASSSPSPVVLPVLPSGAPRPRILVGFSGSVASIKATELLAALGTFAEVRAITTARALHFFSREQVQKQLGVRVYKDEDEWGVVSNGGSSDGDATMGGLWKRGDTVLHIELRRWADMLVIAPLSANTLAKIAHGLCDNLLTTLVRAWPCQSLPLLLAPAMNTLMWDSPFTPRQLRAMQELGAPLGAEQNAASSSSSSSSPSSSLPSPSSTVRVLQPDSKKLACGDVGKGAMASVDAIHAAARQAWIDLLATGYKQQSPPASLADPGLSS